MRRHDSYFRRQRRWLDHNRLSTVARDQLKVIVGEMTGEQKWLVIAPVRAKSSQWASHAHTVVWECCKDDQQSQWEMLKFDPQLPLNPLIDRHQIWCAWLRDGYLLPRKNWAQSVKGFLLPIYAKYTPPCSLRYATLRYATLRYTTLYACLLLFLVLPVAYSRDPCMDFNA